MKTIHFIDLFAGIGGFRYGLEEANRIRRLGSSRSIYRRGKENIHKEKQKSATKETWSFNCVWSNDWDKYASQIYKKHYRECDTRDITKVPSSEIPDHDLLCGGFPCQAFSIAGKRRGFDDTRGTLFFEIARILNDKRPRYFLLENVRGLLSHEEGKTFQTILGVLSDLGYEYQWQVLNSKNFGVPQNRERVFIIGHLGGTPRPKVFPIGVSNENNTESPKKLREQISNTLRTNYSNGKSNETHVGETGKLGQAMRVNNINKSSVTLKGLGGGLGAKTGLYAIPVLTPDREQKRQNGRRFKTNGEPAFTLTGQDIHGVMVSPTLYGFEHGTHKHFNEILPKAGLAIRRLTPTECERLQGFPDGWTEFGVNGEISDTQRYKCLGNAVTTNVVTEIGKRLAQQMLI